jgi:hypothetical protein
VAFPNCAPASWSAPALWRFSHNCPDTTAILRWTTGYSGANVVNISYFASLEATNESDPQLILNGDSNLQINGKPVKSGLLSVGIKDLMSWQPNRHVKSGNVGLADGSAMFVTASGLQRYMTAGIATNRLAIP